MLEVENAEAMGNGNRDGKGGPRIKIPRRMLGIVTPLKSLL